MLIVSLAAGPLARGQEYAPPPPQPPPPPGYYVPPPPQPPPPPGYYQQQPPPGYYQQQPPPGYYQPPPPPPPYYYPPAPVRPISTGIGDIIAGFIMMPIGLIMIGVSVPLWNDCSNTRFQCFDPNNPFYGDAWAALFLDIFGVSLAIVGTVEVAVGFVKLGRYNRWRQTHRAGLFDLGHGVTLSPTATARSAGLTLHF
jgi:hypothetical protein